MDPAATVPKFTDAGPFTDTAVPLPERLTVAEPPLYGADSDPDAGPGASGENAIITVQLFFGSTVWPEQPSVPTIENPLGTLTDPTTALMAPLLVMLTLCGLGELLASTLPKCICAGIPSIEVVATAVGPGVGVAWES